MTKKPVLLLALLACLSHAATVVPLCPERSSALRFGPEGSVVGNAPNAYGDGVATVWFRDMQITLRPLGMVCVGMTRDWALLQYETASCTLTPTWGEWGGFDRRGQGLPFGRDLRCGICAANVVWVSTSDYGCSTWTEADGIRPIAPGFVPWCADDYGNLYGEAGGQPAVRFPNGVVCGYGRKGRVKAWAQGQPLACELDDGGAYLCRGPGLFDRFYLTGADKNVPMEVRAIDSAGTVVGMSNGVPWVKRGFADAVPVNATLAASGWTVTDLTDCSGGVLCGTAHRPNGPSVAVLVYP